MRLRLLAVWMLTPGTAAAQSLKVTVRSDRQPLVYACVYVNGKAAAITDTLGIALLPEGEWEAGDTLSASYVGTMPGRQVIDGRIGRSGECELVLQEMYTLTAEEVTVKADIEKLFRKNVREVSACIDGLWGEARLEAYATMEFADADSSRHRVEGWITTHRNEVSPRNYNDYNYRLTIKAQPPFDSMQTELLREINDLLRWTTAPAHHFQERDLQGVTRQIGYLGKRDGCRIFRITFPTIRLWWLSEASLFIRIVARIDERTKLLRSVESEYLSADMELSVKLRADYVPYRLSAGWGTGRICMVPLTVDYRASRNGRLMEGTLSRSRFVSPKRIRKPGDLYVPYMPQAK